MIDLLEMILMGLFATEEARRCDMIPSSLLSREKER